MYDTHEEDNFWEVGAGCSDSQVRPHKLPWKQECQVE